jgi:hypothetical protein
LIAEEFDEELVGEPVDSRFDQDEESSVGSGELPAAGHRYFCDASDGSKRI